MPEHDAWRVQYLRIVGRLYRDGRLRLRPSYLTSDAPWTDREGSGDSPLQVELSNESGDTLGRYPVRVYSQCAFGSRPQTEAVRGWVPFHPNTAMVRFMNRGRVIHEIRRSGRAPELRLTWQPPARIEGRHQITWETGAHGAVQFFLRYSQSNGRRWQRIGWRTEKSEASVDFDELPGGERCLIAVVATDGINTVTVESSPFAVRTKPCLAFIVSPIDGATFTQGQPIELAGQGFWLEEARVEREQLHWSSSIDGDLGRGDRIHAEQLSQGRHRITLTAGASGREGLQSIEIVVKGNGDHDYHKT